LDGFLELIGILERFDFASAFHFIVDLLPSIHTDFETLRKGEIGKLFPTILAFIIYLGTQK